MWESGIIGFEIWQVLQGEEWLAFNLFFTLVSIFGIYTVGITLLVKMLTRT